MWSKKETDLPTTGSARVLSFYPFLDEPIDFFSVNYTKDENTAIQSYVRK